MPLNNISVTQTFHLGSTNFFKLENGGTIGDNETKEELVKSAIVFFDATLKKYFPNADDTAIVTAVIVDNKEEYFTQEMPEEITLEEQIRSCKSAIVLKAVYEKEVKGKPEEKIYKAKLKELSKK
jgi:hypothetical protein